TADGKALLVQQFADAADQQDFVMLVVAPVAAPLDRLELGEFLLPIAQDVRLHAAQFADLTDGEVPLCRDRRQVNADVLAAFRHEPAPPGLSTSGWHGRSPHDAR